MIQKYKPHIALLLANAFYGANFTIAKFVMPAYIKPFAFILIRVTGALLFFILLQLFFEREKIEKSDYPRLIISGFFGVAINQLLFFKGLNATIPLNASLIMITTPILVMAFSAILLKEKLRWYKLLGLILGLSGAFLLIGGYRFKIQSATAFGDLLIFINAIFYAIYLIIAKPLMIKYKPLTVIKWVFFFGLFPVMFVSFSEFQQIEWHTFTPKIWWSVAFVVLGATVGAYLFNIYGLSKVNPSIVGAYIYLQPILAIFFAWLLLGEINMTFEKGMAGLLIFAGVYFVSFGKNHFEKKLDN